jgi:hypothetical protein
MLKSTKAQVYALLTTESPQLRKQKIHNIHAAMEALVYGAEKVSTPIRTIFQVRLNRARQAATTWSDAAHQKAIELLECQIHLVTPAKSMLVDKLFQPHE